MARVDKKTNRNAAIHKMVESIIKGNSDEAEDHLHDYLTMLSREMVIGEAEDAEDDDVSKDDDKDDDDKDEDKDDDCEDCGKDPCECDDKDEEVKEDIHHPEGAMSRKVAAEKKSAAGHKAERHGNASPGLDDKVKGKAKYDRYPGKGKMKKHDNLKTDYKKGCEGRDKNLGTTD